MQEQYFRALGVRPQVVAALAKRGIESPFPIQQLVLADAIAGSDVLAKSPTGSGKTLAFGLALIERVRPGGQAHRARAGADARACAQVAEELRAAAAAGGLRIERRTAACRSVARPSRPRAPTSSSPRPGA